MSLEDEPWSDSNLTIFEGAYRKDNGDVCTMVPKPSASGGVNKEEVNLTTLFRPGPRKTRNIEILVIEAELVDEGKDLNNPARPANDEVAKQAMERLEQEQLLPAWRVCEREVYP